MTFGFYDLSAILFIQLVQQLVHWLVVTPSRARVCVNMDASVCCMCVCAQVRNIVIPIKQHVIH